MRSSSVQTQSGFTLVELAITVALAAIVLVIAVPSAKQMFDNSRVSGATNSLLASLNAAHQMALGIENVCTNAADKTACNAIICSSADGATCDGGTSWQNGWIVGRDIDGSDDLSAAELVRVQSAVSGIVLEAYDDTTKVAKLYYNSDGVPDNNADGVSDSSLEFRVRPNVCIGRKELLIVVLSSGSARLDPSSQMCP